mgnify:CR=1 FL=1
MEAITAGDAEGARDMMEVRCGAQRWRALCLCVRLLPRSLPGPTRCHRIGGPERPHMRRQRGRELLRQHAVAVCRAPLSIASGALRPPRARAPAAGKPQPDLRALQRRPERVAPGGAERRPAGWRPQWGQAAACTAVPSQTPPCGAHARRACARPHARHPAARPCNPWADAGRGRCLAGAGGSVQRARIRPPCLVLAPSAR